MCKDMDQALEDIIEIGCERILTSGGKSTAMEGAGVIADLIKKANGRITIMPGSGVNENNAGDLVRFTRATELHSTAKSPVPSKMIYTNEHISLNSNPSADNSYELTDVERVKKILKAANE
jgi:copper homeostasis protein